MAKVWINGQVPNCCEHQDLKGIPGWLSFHLHQGSRLSQHSGAKNRLPFVPHISDVAWQANKDDGDKRLGKMKQLCMCFEGVRKHSWKQ